MLQISALEDKGKFLTMRGIRTLKELRDNLDNIGKWLPQGKNIVSIVE